MTKGWHFLNRGSQYMVHFCALLYVLNIFWYKGRQYIWETLHSEFLAKIAALLWLFLSRHWSSSSESKLNFYKIKGGWLWLWVIWICHQGNGGFYKWEFGVASESEWWSGGCIMKASAVLWGGPLRRAGCVHADVQVGLLVNRPPLLLTRLITILVYLLTDLQGPSLLQLSCLGLQAYSLLFEYKIRLNLQSFSLLSCEIMGWCKVSPSTRVTVRASHSREQWTFGHTGW